MSFSSSAISYQIASLSNLSLIPQWPPEGLGDVRKAGSLEGNPPGMNERVQTVTISDCESVKSFINPQWPPEGLGDVRKAGSLKGNPQGMNE